MRRAKLTQFEYEKKKFQFVQPAQKRYYLADWYDEGNKIVLETKGLFSSSDRKKMLLVREQCPGVEIILIFGRSQNTLTKRSTTTYSDWCEKNGFLWCDISDFEENPKKCLSNLMKKKARGNCLSRRTPKKTP